MSRLFRPAFALVLAASCAQAPSPLNANQSALEQSFADAAKEFQVPVEVLKAIAYVETRVAADESVASSFGGHGIMALVGREDWNTLARAQALTGLSQADLSTNSAANIRGAAAVLRALADKTFADNVMLNPNELGDWFQAVSLYPGFESAQASMAYAADVFGRIERGYTVRAGDGEVTLRAAAPNWRRYAPAEEAQQGLGDYPGIATYRQSPNYSSGRSSYTYVLIHTVQGGYAGAVSWLTNSASHVSAHYVVRSSDGQITQLVQDGNTAWHAQCYNSKSIGIEHEGFVADPGKWYTDALYTESAKLTRWLTDKHGIPRDRNHIIGHFEVAKACNTNGHTDPGSGWNWGKYMDLVNGGSLGGAGKFGGITYEGGDLNKRVPGALITLQPGGQTVTTDAQGVYTIIVFPGTYTMTATKAGYTTSTQVKVAPANTPTWAMFEMNPTAATGKLYGTIYKYNAATPTDTSVHLAGAVVSIPGQPSQTVGADGMYRFDLPVGTYKVTATAAGYASNSVTRTTVAGQTIWGSMGLSVGGTDSQPPSLSLSFPAKDAQLDFANVTLTGNASDNAGTIASVKLWLNGTAQPDVAVANGAFSAEVFLKPGANALKLSAKDAAGKETILEQQVTFNAGVAGFVYVAGDESSRVKDMTVEVQEAGTGTVVSSATTDATGAYALAVSTVPADYVVVVKGAGYVSSAQTVSVPADHRLALNIAVTAGENVGQGLEFTSPRDGASVDTASVRVTGTVTGFTVKSVVVNGADAELQDEGAFTALVPLKMGANVIEALATGIGNETVKGRINVTRLEAKSLELVSGGCAAVPVESLAPLALALLALRRRRAL